MKRIFFVLAAAALWPTFAQAQSNDAEIQRALLAAPDRLRADATVLQLRADGTTAVIRPGSNGLICWDNTGRAGHDDAIDSQCTNEANRARLAQNHAFEAAGGGQDAIQARFDEAEANGTRETSEFGSIYFRVRGSTADAIAHHNTVAVPYATPESIGLPGRPGPAMLWLMQGGTSSAHLMAP